ncbi:hypothetical protein [Nonomuraea sp. LPB2021202275-12-8]|uniref:hypothetical protein n=1 Tax=Nonomuraea sp. LPB2021202275-12-8 TaxID=3120159 RepID=UPI00300D8E2A
MLVRRSIALGDLESLLTSTDQQADHAAMRSAIIEDNLLAKGTGQARQNSLRQLTYFYGLDSTMPAFTVFRRLYSHYPREQSILALVLACSHDPVLRSAIAYIVRQPPGSIVSHKALAEVVLKAGATYGPASLHKIAENALASSTMAGITRGVPVRRAEFQPGAASAAYVAWLAHKAGASGSAIFDSALFGCLGLEQAAVREACVEAARRSLLELRAAGNVVEITFRLFEGIIAEAK